MTRSNKKDPPPPNILILQKDRSPGQEKPTDIPWTQALQMMNQWIKEGHEVYVKWTCLKCGSRLTAEKPNQVSILMKHDEPECGHITNVADTGIGFMLVMRNQTLESAQKYLQRYSK